MAVAPTMEMQRAANAAENSRLRLETLLSDAADLHTLLRLRAEIAVTAPVSR